MALEAGYIPLSHPNGERALLQKQTWATGTGPVSGRLPLRDIGRGPPGKAPMRRSGRLFLQMKTSHCTRKMLQSQQKEPASCLGTQGVLEGGGTRGEEISLESHEV